jgi:hypoxanthine-guanine phosphoribosyltransferase
MKQQLRDEDKENITREMWIQQWDKVLILEDLIDTGHTLRILYDFLYNHMVDVHAVCLLDKHVEEWEKVKAEMGKRLQSIIDIWQEFVIGFGMDYEYRLCADIKWLWKIKEWSIPEVKELLNVFTTRIKDILGRPDAA